MSHGNDDNIQKTAARTQHNPKSDVQWDRHPYVEPTIGAWDNIIEHGDTHIGIDEVKDSKIPQSIHGTLTA